MTTIPTREEIEELVKFCRAELADRLVDGVEEQLFNAYPAYVHAAQRAFAIAERLPALVGERDRCAAIADREAAAEADDYDAFAAGRSVGARMIALKIRGGEPVDTSNVVNLRRADDAFEEAARQIYGTWSDASGYVPWVLGGNSDRQTDARIAARRVLAPLIAERDALKKERDEAIANEERVSKGSAGLVALTETITDEYLSRAQSAKAERDRLAAEVERLTKELDDAVDRLAETERALAAARATITRLTDALKATGSVASALLNHFNPTNLPEAVAQQWFALHDQVTVFNAGVLAQSDAPKTHEPAHEKGNDK
jgi:hypothetical protein